ncbi:hypothetical protein Q3G72_035085 [Acer saccharum]|nr:hypothetical protein Q3G72_035085 [Acer saccharum]
MSWLEEDDSVDFSKNVVQLPLCRATRAWFKTLYTPDKWLNDEHIDSALYWIHEVKSKSPTTKMEICTTTDVFFQVYIPLNYESNHWILTEVDFIARKIIVYDYEKNFIGSGKKFIKFMEPLSTLLPLLLHAIDFFSKRPEIHHMEDMTPWLVEHCENVPQQEKSDSGVFVIKFVEHLIHDKGIGALHFCLLCPIPPHLPHFRFTISSPFDGLRFLAERPRGLRPFGGRTTQVCTSSGTSHSS